VGPEEPFGVNVADGIPQGQGASSFLVGNPVVTRALGLDREIDREGLIPSVEVEFPTEPFVVSPLSGTFASKGRKTIRGILARSQHDRVIISPAPPRSRAASKSDVAAPRRLKDGRAAHLF